MILQESNLSPQELAAFAADGFVGPYPLLSEAEIDAVLHDHNETYRSAPWYKSLHVYDSACYRAAVRPEVVDRVAQLLGDDLILWATQVMTKPPGTNHRWHVDIETLAWTSVNVWIALRNVTLRSTIQLVPRSQGWSVSPQELERSDGLDLGDADAILAAAQGYDPNAEVVTVDMRAGDFVIFDGHLWHGSENTTDLTRSALLVQYSPTDVEPREPATFVPPIEWKEELPPCVLVRGVDHLGTHNLITPGPMPSRSLRDRLRDRVKGVS